MYEKLKIKLFLASTFLVIEMSVYKIKQIII